MRTGNAEPVVSTVLLAEYEQLKEEQRARIGFRDNLLYVTLAAATAVIGIAAQTNFIQLVLALPVVCVVLGWTYLVNDEKISAIGRYTRTELSSRLASVTSSEEPIFGWEVYHRSDAKRISRKNTQAIVDLVAFLAAPLAALVGFWCYGTDSGALLISVSAVEAAGLMVLGGLFLAYAER